MKWYLTLLTAVILTVIFGLPFREYKTQQLLPIKTVQAERTAQGVHIVTEVAEGLGETWTAAVADLRQNASGDVFFDTAEQVVLTEESLAVEIAQSGILRPAAQVYFAEALADHEGLHAYLTAHPSEKKISDYGRAS